jgi:hypothetical protein
MTTADPPETRRLGRRSRTAREDGAMDSYDRIIGGAATDEVRVPLRRFLTGVTWPPPARRRGSG